MKAMAIDRFCSAPIPSLYTPDRLAARTVLSEESLRLLLDVDSDGAFAAEDRGQHGHALLGEGVRRVLAAA